jgi:hypothetical protein
MRLTRQLQVQTQDAGAKSKQIKELSRRAIEKLDAALRDEKSAVRTLKSRAGEAEERERRLVEAHAAELGVLQKRLRAAELRSKELQVIDVCDSEALQLCVGVMHAVAPHPRKQALLERDDSAAAPSPPSPRSADGDSGGGAASAQPKPARKQLQVNPARRLEPVDPLTAASGSAPQVVVEAEAHASSGRYALCQ